jgi:hypothetical protein
MEQPVSLDAEDIRNEKVKVRGRPARHAGHNPLCFSSGLVQLAPSITFAHLHGILCLSCIRLHRFRAAVSSPETQGGGVLQPWTPLSFSSQSRLFIPSQAFHSDPSFSFQSKLPTLSHARPIQVLRSMKVVGTEDVVVGQYRWVRH